MSVNNPYTAPQTDLESDSFDSQSYYVVSQKKFFVLSISTLGLYFVWWCWKNWILIKEKEDTSIWPIPRALFYIFFVHKLFTHINDTAENLYQDIDSINNFATVFVISAVGYNICSRFFDNEIVLTLVLVITLCIETWCLWQAQIQANLVCDDEQGLSNDNFTAGNYVLIFLLGGLIWFGLLAELFIPV